MDSTPWPDDSIFEPFDILEETFKTVGDHEIKIAILMPKGLQPGVHPVMYRLHGGFLVAGHGLHAPFWERWQARLAVEHGAIIVSPDFRLLPTPNGVEDQIEDVLDGWHWVTDNLPGIFRERYPGHVLDFTHTSLQGASAGGYLAVQLALSHPDAFKVLALAYPLLDLKDRLYVCGPDRNEPNVFHTPDEFIPSKEAVLAWIKEERMSPKTRSESERTIHAIGATHAGIYSSELACCLGEDKKDSHPIERILSGASLPRNIWIMHGDADSVVPIRGSYKFAAAVLERCPGTKLRFDSMFGHDHAFDFDESNWSSVAPDAMDFFTRPWLGHRP